MSAGSFRATAAGRPQARPPQNPGPESVVPAIPGSARSGESAVAMSATFSCLRLVGSPTMPFAPRITQKLRIPLSVVERATATLLQLLRRSGEPDDMARLLHGWSEAADLLERFRLEHEGQGLLARLGTYIFAMPPASRNAKTALLAAGLGQDELVPFVAAFMAHVRTHVDAPTLTRLLVRVPGLTRLCTWPLAAERA